MGLKTDWVKVAQSGATVDGRTIERTWLEQAAKNYSEKTYTACIWPDHWHDQKFGKVLALKTENVGDEIALLAILAPNASYLSANKYGLHYFSIEIVPNFAETGEAYLTGLAVTDNPASLGTDELKFSTRAGAENSSFFIGAAFQGLFDELEGNGNGDTKNNILTTQENEKNFFAWFRKLFSVAMADENAENTEPKTIVTKDTDMDEKKILANITACENMLAKYKNDLADLKAKNGEKDSEQTKDEVSKPENESADFSMGMKRLGTIEAQLAEFGTTLNEMKTRFESQATNVPNSSTAPADEMSELL